MTCIIVYTYIILSTFFILTYAQPNSTVYYPVKIVNPDGSDLLLTLQFHVMNTNIKNDLQKVCIQYNVMPDQCEILYQDIYDKYLQYTTITTINDEYDTSYALSSSSPSSLSSLSSSSTSYQHYSNITRYSHYPTLFIIGVQKAGTTALSKTLNQHPNISIFEEIHYFDFLYTQRPVHWYMNQFQYSDITKHILGDKTPALMYVHDSILRIRHMIPYNVKFIVCLRNPIDRAYSHWNMNVHRGIETLSFEQAIMRNINHINEEKTFNTAMYHYVQRGFYYEQLKQIVQIYPKKENIHIIISEQLRVNPSYYYHQLLQFLEVDDTIELSYTDEFQGSYNMSIHPETYQFLYHYYLPYNNQLFKWLGYNITEWLKYS